MKEGVRFAVLSRVRRRGIIYKISVSERKESRGRWLDIKDIFFGREGEVEINVF